MKVMIVGNNSQVQNIFRKKDFEIIYDSNLKIKPDLLCFTGGEDVNPSLYGEQKFFKTMTNPKRDAREMVYFERFPTIPKVGICRGGQLLNVLSGGALWQDVNNHVDEHKAIDLLFSKKEITVSSTHHQMMIPGDGSYILCAAHQADRWHSGKKRKIPQYDPEVLWYPKTNSLCFQPHPEKRLSNGSTECEDYFFDLIDWAFK